MASLLFRPPHEAILGRGDECAWIEIKKLDLVGSSVPELKTTSETIADDIQSVLLDLLASSGRSDEGRGDFVMRKNTRLPIFSI